MTNARKPRARRVSYLILTVAAVLCVVVGGLTARKTSRRRQAPAAVGIARQPDLEPVSSQSTLVLVPTATERGPTQAAPPPPPTSSQVGSVEKPRTEVPTKKSAAKGAKSPKTPKEPVKDPLARVALSLVGTDPEAEEYW